MKVLIVDDSATCRIRVRTFLEENGYEIYEADSGISGLEVLKDNSEIYKCDEELKIVDFYWTSPSNIEVEAEFSVTLKINNVD